MARIRLVLDDPTNARYQKASASDVARWISAMFPCVRLDTLRKDVSRVRKLAQASR